MDVDQPTARPERGRLTKAHPRSLVVERNLTGLEERFAREGLTERDLEEWRWSPSLPFDAEEMTAQAVVWRDSGFDASTAVQYCVLGWTVARARPWHRAGYTPTQAHFANPQIHWNRLKHLDDFGAVYPASTREEWWASGLTSEWVCLGLGAGLTTVAEVLARTGGQPEGGEIERLRLTFMCLSRGTDINAVNFGLAY